MNVVRREKDDPFKLTDILKQLPSVFPYRLIEFHRVLSYRWQKPLLKSNCQNSARFPWVSHLIKIVFIMRPPETERHVRCRSPLSGIVQLLCVCNRVKICASASSSNS